MFNVRDFGARGDGITDDSPAIQAAVDAAHGAGEEDTAGGIVWLPAGTYRIATAIELKSRLSFRGAGSSNTILKTDEPTYSLDGMGQATNVMNKPALYTQQGETVHALTVSDLTINGSRLNTPYYTDPINGLTNPLEQSYGLEIRGAEDVLITRVRAINCAGDGIRTNNGTHGVTSEHPTQRVTLKYCSVEHCWRFGVGIQRFSNNISIRDCSFRDIYAYMIKAENNYTESVENPDELLTGLLITGCHFESVNPETESGKAIGISSDSAEIFFRDMVISNNIIHGIVEVQRAKRLLIEGNTIVGVNDNPGSDPDNRSCVHLMREVEDATVRNNILRWSSSGGVALFYEIDTNTAESKRIIIVNNILIDDSTETETEYGHGVQARRASGFMVNGNILFGNGYRDGVRLDPELGMSEVQVLDNQIAAVQHGVAVHETAEASEDLARLDLSGNAVMEVSEGGAALRFGEPSQVGALVMGDNVLSTLGSEETTLEGEPTYVIAGTLQEESTGATEVRVLVGTGAPTAMGQPDWVTDAPTGSLYIDAYDADGVLYVKEGSSTWTAK